MLSRRVKIFVVYCIALLCLLWVVRDVRPGELSRQLKGVMVPLLLPAVLLDIVTTVTHGVRWRLLLGPLGSVSLFRTVQTIYVSLFANELLPLRAGEAVRGYVMSKELRRSFFSVLPSMIVERIADGLLLIIGAYLCTFFVSLPVEVVRGIWITGAVTGIVVAALVVLDLTSRKRSGNLQTTTNGLVRFLERLRNKIADGMRIIRTRSRFTALIALSALYLAFQIIAYWLVLRAYGLHLSIWIPAVMIVVVRLGTAVPSAPANIGPFQFFSVLALTMFGIDKTTATGVAFTLWLTFTIPILVLGLIAFIRSGVNLSRIR